MSVSAEAPADPGARALGPLVSASVRAVSLGLVVAAALVPIAIVFSISRIGEAPRYQVLAFPPIVGAIGFTFGASLLPVLLVEAAAARRPPSFRRDATAALAAFATALASMVVAWLDLNYLRGVVRALSVATAYRDLAAEAARLWASPGSHAGTFLTLALPFPFLVLARLRGVGLKAQVFLFGGAFGAFAMLTERLGQKDMSPAMGAAVIAGLMPLALRAADAVERRLAARWPS